MDVAKDLDTNKEHALIGKTLHGLESSALNFSARAILFLIYFAFMGWMYAIGQMGLIGIALVTLFALFCALILCWANKAMWTGQQND